jgi:hypothetical protein
VLVTTLGGVVVLGCLIMCTVYLGRIVHLLRKLIAMQAETNALTAAKVVRPDISHSH